MSATTDKPYRVRNCSRHEDPDNSGQCIHCGGITFPDDYDWATQPEICIGERPADRFPCGDEIEEPTSTMSTTNDEQAKYDGTIHIGPADEQLRVPITFDDGTTMILDLNDLPDVEHKPTDRAPMLTNAELSSLSYSEETMSPDSYGDGWDLSNKEENWFNGAKYVRDYCESLITKGVLRVAKTSTMQSDGTLDCEDPQCLFTGQAYGFKYCPECAGRIVKA